MSDEKEGCTFLSPDPSMRTLSFLATSAALGFALTTLISAASTMAQGSDWAP